MTAASSTAARQARGPNWDPSEDKILARAWITVSTDASVGTDQKQEVFWEKVAQHYNANRPRSHSRYERSQSSIMKRWKVLRVAVGKFCGCFASIVQLNQSGKSAEDQVNDAMVMYEKLTGESFEHVSAWRELRDAPKWKDMQRASNPRTVSRKRSTSDAELDAPAEQLAAPSHPEQRSRPAGSKKAKDERSQEISNQRLADAVVAMSKTSDKKAAISAEKLRLLKEREESRILFQSSDGLDPTSQRILELKKQQILRRLEAELATQAAEVENENPNVGAEVEEGE